MSSKTGKKSKGAKYVPKAVEHAGGAGTAQRVKFFGSQNANTPKASWKPNLSAYREKLAFKFSSQVDMNAFIDLVWSDQDLHGMPHVPVGDNTVIVPAVARTQITSRVSVKCSITSVLDPRTLAPYEFAELCKERDTV
jgi:hypothetical protein